MKKHFDCDWAVVAVLAIAILVVLSMIIAERSVSRPTQADNEQTTKTPPIESLNVQTKTMMQWVNLEGVKELRKIREALEELTIVTIQTKEQLEGLKKQVEITQE